MLLGTVVSMGNPMFYSMWLMTYTVPPEQNGPLPKVRLLHLHPILLLGFFFFFFFKFTDL